MDRGAIDGPRALKAAFDMGSDRVLLRGASGDALDATLDAFVAERSREGKVLVLVPQASRETIGARLRAGQPGLSVGDWDADAIVEVATPMHAGPRARERLPETFACIVVEECHRANGPMIEAVVGHFAGAQVLEVVRRPAPEVGNLAHDREMPFRAASAGSTAS